VDDDRALVVTTDFFTPVVDTPYEYGAIAAANSLSDVYAMGGRPFLALNISAFPTDLPEDLLAEIVRGAAHKAKEAGVVIAGGHTVQDQEPKFGLVALGLVSPEHILTKHGALSGDRLVLTKPLGFGTITTALKQEKATIEDVEDVVRWMKLLNDHSSALAVETGLKGATDVTGFSLLGHAWEMAQASQTAFRFFYKQIPFLESARRYADMGAFAGGAYDNRSYYRNHVRFPEGFPETDEMLLFDPQTSGGLLLCVPAGKLDAFNASARARHIPTWEIGIVVEGQGIEVV